MECVHWHFANLVVAVDRVTTYADLYVGQGVVDKSEKRLSKLVLFPRASIHYADIQFVRFDAYENTSPEMMEVQAQSYHAQIPRALCSLPVQRWDSVTTLHWLMTSTQLFRDVEEIKSKPSFCGQDLVKLSAPEWRQLVKVPDASTDTQITQLLLDIQKLQDYGKTLVDKVCQSSFSFSVIYPECLVSVSLGTRRRQNVRTTSRTGSGNKRKG
jgi:hypothetical protein